MVDRRATVLIRRCATSKRSKYEASFDSGRTWPVKFGAVGYRDFTLLCAAGDMDAATHARWQYVKRHACREDWGASGIHTAGFWARWILWNKPTVEMSARDISRRRVFGVRVVVVA